MKKWLSILLAATVTASSAIGVFADNQESPFTDVSDPAFWAYPHIIAMAEEGFITGVGDNLFMPDNDVTRLEVLALFSRALGALDKVNKPLVEMAVEKYGDVIAEYDLGWGVNEIAFLMYRGILTEDDLITYLDGSLKGEPMPRYEAAIIITKAMGGASTAANAEDVSLSFADADEVPENAKGYIAYVNDRGVMTGMDNNMFGPTKFVSRAQMAVMLYRTWDIMDYSYEKGKLLSVDVGGRLVTYLSNDGETVDVGYSKNVLMNVLGEPTAVKNMTTGVNAIITRAGNTVAFVDTLGDIPDATISGKYVARSISNGLTSITIKNSDTNENETYTCIEDVEVTYNGSPASITNLKENDHIVLRLENGEIVKVKGETKVTKIENATLEDITLEPDFTITISHALEEYDGLTLEVATDATVRKNGKDSDFSEVYPGDTVALTMEYGVVQSVVASSTERALEGTIQAINISARPSIEVKVNGEVKTYYVTNDVVITINGEDASLYDFRVGDSIKVVLKGQAVTKMSATAAQSTSGKIDGVITSVNQSYGFIKISYKNSDGYTVEETVYCKDATTKVMTDMGTAKKVMNLKEGQNVIATGTTSNGAFVAKLIVISEA